MTTPKMAFAGARTRTRRLRLCFTVPRQRGRVASCGRNNAAPALYIRLRLAGRHRDRVCIDGTAANARTGAQQRRPRHQRDRHSFARSRSPARSSTFNLRQRHANDAARGRLGLHALELGQASAVGAAPRAHAASRRGRPAAAQSLTRPQKALEGTRRAARRVGEEHERHRRQRPRERLRTPRAEEVGRRLRRQRRAPVEQRPQPGLDQARERRAPAGFAQGHSGAIRAICSGLWIALRVERAREGVYCAGDAITAVGRQGVRWQQNG